MSLSTKLAKTERFFFFIFTLTVKACDRIPLAKVREEPRIKL